MLPYIDGVTVSRWCQNGVIDTVQSPVTNGVNGVTHPLGCDTLTPLGIVLRNDRGNT